MTSAEASPKFDIVTLSPAQRSRVHVMDPSRAKLVMTMEQAVRACHAYEKQLTFQHQFETLLVVLGQWWTDRRDRVEKAWVTVRDTGLLFIVGQREVELDSQLEEDLASLIVSVIRDEQFNLIRLEAISLPPCDEIGFATFANPSVTLELALDA